jgi:hypothetical protein
MLKPILCTIMAFVCACSLSAQKGKSKGDEPDNKNIEKYLNDGRIGNVKNLVRFRTNRAAGGYLGLSYERKFGRKFGLEGGLYYKPFKGVEMEAFRFSENTYSFGNELQEINGGVGFLLYPKKYITGTSINNGYFFGLRTSFQSYKTTMLDNYFTPTYQKGVKSQSLSAYIMAGSHQQFASRFTFGLEWGGGFHIDQYKDVEYKYDDGSGTGWGPGNIVTQKKDVKFTSWALAIDLSFGFLF